MKNNGEIGGRGGGRDHFSASASPHHGLRRHHRRAPTSRQPRPASLHTSTLHPARAAEPACYPIATRYNALDTATGHAATGHARRRESFRAQLRSRSRSPLRLRLSCSSSICEAASLLRNRSSVGKHSLSRCRVRWRTSTLDVMMVLAFVSDSPACRREALASCDGIAIAVVARTVTRSTPQLQSTSRDQGSVICGRSARRSSVSHVTA